MNMYASLFTTCMSLLAVAAAARRLHSTSAGILNSTLVGYVNNSQLWSSRSAWYNIEAWAARTSNCAGNDTATVCMACSENMPAYSAEAGVVPIAVSNELWFNPARAAVCSMCLKVYMPPGNQSACPNGNYGSNASCPGFGSQPLISNVQKSWAYSANVQHDSVKGLDYFIGNIIEWYDRNQTLPYALTYPVQGLDTDTFGTWPIQYEGTPCPVGKHNLAYQFLNNSAPYPAGQSTNQTAWTESGSSTGIAPSVASSLCNNELNDPCGASINNSAQPPLGFIKFQVIGQRIPISAVQLKLQDGKWYDTHLSGDGYWQPNSALGFAQDPTQSLDIMIFCSDGSAPKVDSGVIPTLCAYQDPTCNAKEGTIQC